MDINLINLILQAVSGLIGGAGFGAIAKNLSLGGLGNTLAGLLGGGLGGQLLSSYLNLPPIDPAALDPMAVIGQAATGAGGGVAATLIAGLLRGMFAK